MSTNNVDKTNSSIGKIITFGSLHLLLKLKLEQEDLKSVNFKNLKNLEDLSFLTDNEKLWNKIELVSKNELLQLLLQANKIKHNKNIISYLVFGKIEYDEKQNQFQKLIDCVLLDNGLIIKSYQVCESKVSINLKLTYKKAVKKFVIYGEEDYYDDDEEEVDKNEEAEEEKQNKSENSQRDDNDTSMNKDKGKSTESNGDNQDQEEEEEENTNDIGLFENIPKEEVKFEDFKYIYIHLNDFISDGEFSNKFTLNQIYNFLQKMKKDSNIKIIFNFGDNFGENEKYLIKFMKLSDIHIIRNRNALFNIIKKRVKREEKRREEEKKKMKDLFRTQKIGKNKSIKKISKNTSSTSIRQNKLNQSSKEGFYYSTSMSFPNKLNKSQSMKDIYLSQSQNLNQTFDKFNRRSLDKNNMYSYINELIYIISPKERHPNYSDKMGIYLDEYKKMFIVDYKRTSFIPGLTEFDLNIYPKSNVYNSKEIQDIKNILTKNNVQYTNILYGCILCTILGNLKEGSDNYFMFYYYSRISILKILALKKNKLPKPKDKSFYIVQIDKNELKKMQKEENTKRKEDGFNNNHFQMKYKGNDSKYYPLMDKFLTSYMQSNINIDILKNKNLINENKKILYDPEYKDLYKFGGYNPLDINNKKFAKFIMKENLSKNIYNKEKDYKKEFLSKKPEMKYHIPGIDGIPEYIVYLDKEERKKLMKKKLPPIKKKKEVVMILNAAEPQKVEERKLVVNEGANNNDVIQEEEKVDVSNYKEINFQSTPSERK